MNEKVLRLLTDRLREISFLARRVLSKRIMGKQCFCVMGLICDLYRQETGRGEWVADPDRTDRYLFRLDNEDWHSGAPQPVLDWASITFGQEGRLIGENDAGEFTSLVDGQLVRGNVPGMIAFIHELHNRS